MDGLQHYEAIEASDKNTAVYRRSAKMSVQSLGAQFYGALCSVDELSHGDEAVNLVLEIDVFRIAPRMHQFPGIGLPFILQRIEPGSQHQGWRQPGMVTGE